ncbi:MAG TPA: DNA polymerase I, partial [Planctomycetota bacterium]|nr:DNA polymerase I [Planctomycetota bacterium]
MTDTAVAPEGALVLVDGSALAYRSHFAMVRQGLSRADGTPTGAVYGFATGLKRLLDRLKPWGFVVVVDHEAPTFRHALYSDYKVTRQKMPDELVVQLPLMRTTAEVMGATYLAKPGVEADDVIATLARRAAAAGREVVVVTGDKDLLQLVGDRIRVLRFGRDGADGEVLDAAAVEREWGVSPAQVADVLALMGDSSDNAPGVPGVGEKTAMKLVREHGSLEKVLEHAGDVAPQRLRTALVEHRDLALLTRRLVALEENVPDLPEVDALAYRGPDREAAERHFRSLEFKTLAEAFAPPRAKAPRDYRCVENAAQLDALVDALAKAPLVAVDTETTSLTALRADLVCLSFSMEDGVAWCVPLRARPPVIEDAPDAPFRGHAVLAKLKPFLEDPRPTKCGQNAKYDVLVLRRHGTRLQGVAVDTMLASYLLEPGRREHNLDALVLDRFEVAKIKTLDLLGKGKDQLTMDLVPLEHLSEYACEDADYTRRLAVRFLPELEERGLRKLHDEVELPLLFVLADMEEAGIRVDRDLLKRLAAEWQAAADRLADEICEAAGDPAFNPGSPKQLGELLFERLKCHERTGYRPKKTKTGWATGQEVLDELGDHPLVAKIIEWRSMSKLVSTYVAPLPELCGDDCRIHTSFNQAVAATGRLSSSDPNLQNIPIRTEAGRRIRLAFLPTDSDGKLISADYSQVELRLLAHFSEDEALCEAFRAGRDIHRETAARVFGVAPEQVDAATRGRAKAINFGVLYGMGPQRLARETGMTLDEAKAFIERYFAAFPRIRGYLDGLKAEARRLGYAVTLFGRRRPIPDLDSPNGMLRSQAENMAVNTPIQGSAADLIKAAMIGIHRRLRDESFRTRLVLQVHDELVFDAPADEVARATTLIRDGM